MNTRTLMPSWLQLGDRVRSIQEPSGPEFKQSDIVTIHNPNELIRHLLYPESVHRVAYAIRDVCFIQMNAADENWIVVKGQRQFDAITSINLGHDGLMIYLLCVLGATEDQCRHHQFMVSDTFYRARREFSHQFEIDVSALLSEHIQINH